MTRYEWDTRYEALTAEVERLKAELAQFRPVTITKVDGLVGGLVNIDGKWATVPLEVYLKDEPPTIQSRGSGDGPDQ